MTNRYSSSSGALPNNKRLQDLPLTGGGVLLSVLLLVFLWWFFFGQWRTSTDNAYVGGNIVAVMPQTEHGSLPITATPRRR